MDIKKDNTEILWTIPWTQFDNLGEKGPILEKYNLAKLTQGEKDNLDRLISIKEIIIFNNLPNWMHQAVMSSLMKDYQTFKVSILIFYSLLQNTEVEQTLPNSFYAAVCCAKSLRSYPTLCDPMDWSCQAPLIMGFSRQEYWSRLPCSPPGDLPNSGIEPASPAAPTLQADS